MLKSTEQESWKYRIAVFNKRLHEDSICPANHEVAYHNGWYYFDGEPRQRPDVTREARKLENDMMVEVAFQSCWNTYVIVTEPQSPAEVRA
jgi:hypothetical protein